jgi:hypothetical protein
MFLATSPQSSKKREEFLNRDEKFFPALSLIPRCSYAIDVPIAARQQPATLQRVFTASMFHHLLQNLASDSNCSHPFIRAS